MRNAHILLSYSILIYLVLLGVHGYGYGGNDQIEIIPVLKYWNNPDLFSQDFFMTNFSERVFTERTPLLLFLNYTLGWGPWAILFWHFFFSILLISGLLKIATHLCGDRLLAIMAVILTLTVGYRTSLGGNELYYNLLIGSLIAKALSAWAIFYWLNKRLLTPYILLGVASYFQPLVSLQIMLVLGIYHLRDVDFIKRFIPAVLAFAIIAGPWVLALLLNRNTSVLSASDYLEIIEFRLAHHFLPQYFDWKDYGIVLGLVVLSWNYYRNRFKPILGFINIALIIAIFYSVSVVVFNSTLLINTQWFKITIWIEFFGVIAMLSLLKKAVRLDTNNIRYRSILTILVVALFLRSWLFGNPPSFDLPFLMHQSDELDLSQWVKQNTDPDDVFLLPLSFSYFKNSAERPSFIDFKAMIHDEAYMKRMYGNIHRYYDLNVLSRRNGEMNNLDQIEPRTDQETVNELIGKGVDYIVLPNSKQMPSLKKSATFGNKDGWSVYKL